MKTKDEIVQLIIEATPKIQAKNWWEKEFSISDGLEKFFELLKKEILEIDYEEVKEEAWKIYEKHYHEDGFGGIMDGTTEEKRRYLREAVEYFKLACNGQRSQQSHDGRFYAITTIDEVGIKEFKKDEIQLQTPYGYFKNQRDCQECIDFFKEQIDFLEID